MELTYIFSAVVLLGLCIFIHELGHLLGGKMVGIKAKTFSIGYGKGVLKKKIGDTTYQLTLIPFGGFCQFYGEDPSEDRKGESFEFLSAHPLKRIVTVIMGPLFNLFFGILLFFMMNLIGYSTETNKIRIPQNLKTGDYISPAYSAGLRTGDKIINISGDKVNSYTGILYGELFSEGKPLKIKADRNGEILDFTVKPIIQTNKKEKKRNKRNFYTMGIEPYGESVLIAGVVEDDIADKAGIEVLDKIVLMNDEKLKGHEDFINRIKKNIDRKIKLTLIRGGDEEEMFVTPRLRESIEIRQFEDNRFKGEKYEFLSERLDLIKKAIEKKSLKINGKRIASFSEFKQVLKQNGKKRIKLQNTGGTYYGFFKYDASGFLGIYPRTSPDMIELQFGIIDGIIEAFVEPYNFIVVNLKGIGMLISGDLDVRENLSGPIKIAKIAGDVTYLQGVSAFIILMAKISIILMVMNLLPIPVVDGSFILFFLYEAIRGKPINEKVLEKIQAVGIMLLIFLGIFVIFNDLLYFPFFQKLFN